MTLSLMILLTACEMTPNFVESQDIDNAMAHQRFATMCVGLEMDDPDVRRYATERLRAIEDPEGIALANECICAEIVDPNEGWDSAIAAGLKGSTDDAKVSCFAELVQNPALPQRTAAVIALGYAPAPSSKSTLIAVAQEAGADAETRSRAIVAVGSSEEAREAMISLVSSDSEATVRAAAAEALSGAKRDKDAQAALQTSVETDASGEVRAAALMALKQAMGTRADDLVCDRMMNDESPTVRTAAVASFRGTNRKKAVECLRTRAMTVEEDVGVREKIMTVLKSSPHEDAAKALCDAIPFWMRNYAQEGKPSELPGVDMVQAQNDRDWENSYDCVGRAYRNSSGYSCYAKQHVGHWYRELGGQAYVPRCAEPAGQGE